MLTTSLKPTPVIFLIVHQLTMCVYKRTDSKYTIKSIPTYYIKTIWPACTARKNRAIVYFWVTLVLYFVKMDAFSDKP
jgi:hypothetical protein